MLRALTALGHEVDLLTYPQGQPVDVPGVSHARSLWLPVGRVRAGASLAKIALDVPFLAQAVFRLFTRRYDAVQAVEEAAHLIAPFARLRGVPLVADVDSSIPEQLRQSGFARGGPLLWAAEFLERRALRSASVVVTVCTALTDGVKRQAPAARVFQIEDPPLVDAAPPEPEAVAKLRASLRLGPEPVALYTGNFEGYQGVPLLVEAAARLPQVQFLFVGGEPSEIVEMQRQAAAIGARAVFAGKRPPSELPLYLALADVLVSPRLRGSNTPFKVYTYLASGRPLVATRIESHTQLLDESLAFLVEATAEAIAAGVRTALEGTVEARARAARGQALVEREYSEKRYREKVEAAYGALAS
jgi:glycosyltransferase involved in cell wall biosynthesis